LYKNDAVGRFVIDEIHCVKQWGEDFRFAYKDLKQLKEKYNTVPILGLSATATISTRK
jgi:superfamily II DNA helicase RecQ